MCKNAGGAISASKLSGVFPDAWCHELPEDVNLQSILIDITEEWQPFSFGIDAL